MTVRRSFALVMGLVFLLAYTAGPLAQAANGQSTPDPSSDPLAVPRSLTAASGNSCVRLSWLPPQSPPEPVVFYNLYCAEGAVSPGDPALVAQLDPHTFSYIDFGVVNDETYVYQIRAQYDDKIESSAGSTATARPKAAGLSVILRVDQTAAEVNGANVVLDAPAQIVGGATMVPLRFVASSLGADVKYDSGPRMITATLGPRVVRLWIGGKEAEIDGGRRPIASPPCLIQGRTMVPVRFISEAFGATVAYIAAERKVTVDMPDNDAAMDRATPLAIGVPVRAALNGSSDVDYYRLQTTPGETYVAATHDLGAGCDTVLVWLQASGVVEVSDDASRDSKASEIQVVKFGEDAFLYFRVQTADPGGAHPSGNYSLTVNRRAIDPLQDIDALLVDAAPQEGELLSPSDRTYYSFSATAGQTYRVSTENLPPEAGSEGTTNQADTSVWLLDVPGDSLEVVTADDNSSTADGDPYAADVYYTARATGPCYILVNSQTGEPGRYRIQVAGAVTTRGDPATATATAVDRQAWRNWLDYAQAENWYKFEAVQGTRYWLQTLDLGPMCDTVLTLFDTDSQTALGDNDDSPGRGNGAMLEWVAPANATYYARVSPYEMGLGGYVFCVTTTGPEYDYDDLDYATAVTVDGEPQPASAVSGDYDWFTFAATKGQTYTIETTDLSPGCDTYLVVMDENGAVLGENDDINYDEGILASRVEWTATATITVYARVSPRSEGEQTGTGTYQLKVTKSARGSGF
jgi:hypothetical protein